jgi:hypothetical protein
MTPDEVATLFTRADGTYLFARWGRPIVPVVFGVDDATLSVVKGAVEAVATLAGHPMAETDAELGANLMVFFLRDWAELAAIRDLDKLIPDLGPLTYRAFRFESEGQIKAAFVFLRMDAPLSEMPAEDLALLQAAQVILLWSDRAFAGAAPLVRADGVAVLRPDIAAVICAAYDRMMPPVARDPSHALRMAARLVGA